VPLRWILWCAAGLSLVAGVWLSLDPVRLVDFVRVVAWVQHWREGITPFTDEIASDYPPWALVTLLPLAWMPDAWRAPLWIAANLGFSLYIVHALTHLLPAQRRLWWWLPVLLCVVSFRTLGQFSLLSFALALAGARARSDWMGGVWLGLALMKPQVGGVMWIAHVCLRDWRRVSVAVFVPIVLTLVCAWGLSQSPVTLLGDYARVVSHTHGGEIPFLGHTELESWLWRAFGVGTSLPVAGALALGLLAPGAVAVWRVRPDTPERVCEWYGYCGVVSLLATRHLSYDLMLIAPLVMAWTTIGPRAAGVAVLMWLTLYPPAWWRQFFEATGLPAALGVVTELDRVLLVAIWVFAAFRLVLADKSVRSSDMK
jgi:hypothetical protein